jgi:hypothetical protein
MQEQIQYFQQSQQQAVEEELLGLVFQQVLVDLEVEVLGLLVLEQVILLQ